ncbi:threonine synthase, partial [Robertkochia marina]
MEYQSTRAAAARLSFSETLLTCLAKDGGLIVPTHYPQLSLETIESWRFLSYQDLALALMRLFISDIPEDKLRTLINAAYSPENFPDADITPIKNIGNDLYLLHLSNGPTLAFKDIAMQLLGQLFE